MNTIKTFLCRLFFINVLVNLIPSRFRKGSEEKPANAPVFTPELQVTLTQAKNGRWRWTAFGNGGKCVAVSPVQGYVSRERAKKLAEQMLHDKNDLKFS